MHRPLERGRAIGFRCIDIDALPEKFDGRFPISRLHRFHERLRQVPVPATSRLRWWLRSIRACQTSEISPVLSPTDLTGTSARFINVSNRFASGV